MIVLKTSRELAIMREAGRISAMALKVAGEAVEPGVSTWEIDRVARKYIESQAVRRNLLPKVNLLLSMNIFIIPRQTYV